MSARTLARPAFGAALLTFVMALFACATPAQAAWYQDTDYSDKQRNGYLFAAWTNGWNNSRGYFTRTYDVSNSGVSYLWLNFKQTGNGVGSTGADAGVGRAIPARRMSEMIDTNGSKVNDGVYYRFTEKINARNNDDFWIQGPKTIVTEYNGWGGLNGQYECYIVDSSNRSRDWIASHYGLSWKSSGNYDGTTYHFYTRDLWTGSELIKQIFTMRQDWRGSWDDNGRRVIQGWTPTNWIMRQWRTAGLIPNDGVDGKTWYCLGWKVNIETEGEFWDSECGWSYLSLPYNY